jgi:putative ABC transport system ATP-binding protein
MQVLIVSPEYVVQAQGLKKTYKLGKTEVQALRGVDINASAGEFLSVMGVSGSGKSTLLHLLGGLDRPTEGTIKIDGVDISKLKDSQLADLRSKKIGFVFQFFNLLTRLTALRNVRLPLEIAGSSAKEAQKRALELLKLVGLEDRADHRPTELSGGEQQRVAVARALTNNPKIILADEPTGNLDTKTGMDILQLLKQLAKERGRTLIIVSHDLRVAELADRTINLRDGLVVNGKVRKESS